VSILISVFSLVLALLVLAAAVRLRGERARSSLVDDAAIRAIEMRGSVEIDDEPLDPAEIDEEERRFWEEERWE
jgi:hypothetical protein